LLADHVTGDEARELEKEADRIEVTVTYAAMEEEIDAAMAIREEHRAECQPMMADTGAAMEQVLELAAEARFDALRISVDELQGAFEVVGYPPVDALGLTEEGMDVIFKASMHLVGDEEDRLTRSRQLLIALPEYVAAGRYCDAWLLRYSAYRMTVHPEESNPFMFGLVTLAFEAWGEKNKLEMESLFEALGVDPVKLAPGDPEHRLASVKELVSDAESRKRVERFFEARPEFRAMAEKEVWELDSQACALLEREDVGCILPSPDEVVQWVEELMERTHSFRESARSRLERDEVLGEVLAAEAQEVFIEVVREMTEALYTPERVAQLIEDLKAYRRTLQAAGEEEAARRAKGALILTAVGMRPADSAFMAGTCHSAMRRRMRALAEERASAEGWG